MALKNRRIFELRLGKLGLLLFVCGMSLLLFSSFLIGVIVGKHMEAYPERYSSGLTELIRDRMLTSAPKVGEKEVKEVGDEKFGLTFYDTLGGDKGATAVGSRNGDAKNKNSEAPAGQIVPPANQPKKEAPASISGECCEQNHTHGSRGRKRSEEADPVGGRAGRRVQCAETVCVAGPVDSESEGSGAGRYRALRDPGGRLP